jgi:hypothetical protein
MKEVFPGNFGAIALPVEREHTRGHEGPRRRAEMKTHPFLRAYLSGTLIPAPLLPLLRTVFVRTRIMLRLATPIEQATRA